MRAHKTEFFPDGFDEKNNPKGPRAMVLHFFVPNNKRWKKMSEEEKAYAFKMIEEFKGSLSRIQNELFPNS